MSSIQSASFNTLIDAYTLMNKYGTGGVKVVTNKTGEKQLVAKNILERIATTIASLFIYVTRTGNCFKGYALKSAKDVESFLHRNFVQMTDDIQLANKERLSSIITSGKDPGANSHEQTFDQFDRLKVTNISRLTTYTRTAVNLQVLKRHHLEFLQLEANKLNSKIDIVAYVLNNQYSCSDEAIIEVFKSNPSRKKEIIDSLSYQRLADLQSHTTDPELKQIFKSHLCQNVLTSLSGGMYPITHDTIDFHLKFISGQISCPIAYLEQLNLEDFTSETEGISKDTLETLRNDVLTKFSHLKKPKPKAEKEEEKEIKEQPNQTNSTLSPSSSAASSVQPAQGEKVEMTPLTINDSFGDLEEIEIDYSRIMEKSETLAEYFKGQSKDKLKFTIDDARELDGLQAYLTLLSEDKFVIADQKTAWGLLFFARIHNDQQLAAHIADYFKRKTPTRESQYPNYLREDYQWLLKLYPSKEFASNMINLFNQKIDGILSVNRCDYDNIDWDIKGYLDIAVEWVKKKETYPEIAQLFSQMIHDVLLQAMNCMRWNTGTPAEPLKQLIQKYNQYLVDLKFIPYRTCLENQPFDDRSLNYADTIFALLPNLESLSLENGHITAGTASAIVKHLTKLKKLNIETYYTTNSNEAEKIQGILKRNRNLTVTLGSILYTNGKS